MGASVVVRAMVRVGVGLRVMPGVGVRIRGGEPGRGSPLRHVYDPHQSLHYRIVQGSTVRFQLYHSGTLTYMQFCSAVK